MSHSPRIAVGRSSGSFTGINAVPVLWLSPSANIQIVRFGDTEVAASGFVGFGVVPNAGTVSAQINTIPVEDWSPLVRIKGESQSNRSERHIFLVVSAYAPADCSPGVIMDPFPQKASGPLTCTKEESHCD